VSNVAPVSGPEDDDPGQESQTPRKEGDKTNYLFVFYYWRSVGHAGGEKQDDSSDFALDCTADG
jgi:hypothetical protein